MATKLETRKRALEILLIGDKLKSIGAKYSDISARLFELIREEQNDDLELEVMDLLLARFFGGR